MPCRLEPWEIEVENRRIRENETRARTATEVEVLSAKVDYLRDLIWRLWNPELVGDVPADEVETVINEQERHRQDDLDRLAKAFVKDLSKHRDKLKKVLEADPSKPLEPQLGFDPDKF